MTAHRRGVLCLSAAALLWSTGGLGIKSVDAGPLVVAFYRCLVAAVALFLLRRPPRPTVAPRFVLGMLAYAGCLITFVVATKWTTAANAIFLQYSGVVWVLLLSPLLLREPLRARDAIAVMAALCGMGLFFAGRLDRQGLQGSIVALISGAFFAAIFLTLRGAAPGMSEAAIAWGNVAAVALILPFVLTSLSVDALSFLVLCYLGLFQIGLSYALFARGLRHVHATEASLISMLEPVCNPVWVFLARGERPTPFAVAGGAIVLLAIGWRTLTAPSPAAAGTP